MTDRPSLSARRGLYFEEFQIGESVTSVGRTITEADVVAFASLSGDWSSIHSDAVYAAQHPLGQRVAHGLLGLSIANALAVRLGFIEGTILAFRGLSEWKFSLPIYINDTIRVRLTIRETRAVPRLGGGMVTLFAEILNQYDQVVQQGGWSMLVMSAPKEHPGGPA